MPLCPPVPLTVISTWAGSPAICAGMEWMTMALFETVMPDAGRLIVRAPIVSAVAPLKRRPKMVTLLPPLPAPNLGLTLVTAMPKLYRLAVVLVSLFPALLGPLVGALTIT